MKQAKRLFFNLNVSPEKLKNLFCLLSLTFCCTFTAYSQCDPTPFDIDAPGASVVLDGSFDFSAGCSSTHTVEAGGEYEITLAASTNYTFTVCPDIAGDLPIVEFWSDQTTYVATFAVDGSCVTYSLSSCEAGPVYLVVWYHCTGNWSDNTLSATCTPCTITCAKQVEALAMDECNITSLKLDDPVITGSCFVLADLEYKIDIDGDGDFVEETAAAYGTEVDGLNPGCYNVKWYSTDADCIVESAACQLCVNSVNLSCKGGTRQFTSLLDCSTEIRIEDVLKNDICEDTEEGDCFVYEISMDGTNWFEDALEISALGSYDISLRVCYYEDCTDQTTAEFCSMVSCFTAEVVNNSAPMCMLGDKSSILYCGLTETPDAPMFLACGTNPTPTSEDEILGACGTYTVGSTEIDLSALTDVDGDGFADELAAVGLDVLIPVDYPVAGAGTCDFKVVYITERTWTATGDNGISSSCSEYIFVLAPEVSCVKVEPYEAECTGDGTTDLSIAALVAIDVKYAPYYTLPDGVTNVSLIDQHDNCKISLSQKGDFPTQFSCPVKSKFLRKWHVIDWCDPSDPLPLTQLVKTVDTTPPTYDTGACPGDDDLGGKNMEIPLTISANCAVMQDVSAYYPAATDICCDVDVYTAKIYFGTEAEVEAGAGVLQSGEGTIYSFTKGFYRLDFTVEDACGNESAVCSKYIEVKDGVTPSAHCRASTIDLDSNLEAKLNADLIGAGSTDNCSIACLEIGLMPLDGSDPVFVKGDVIVSCAFVNPATSSVMVAIRATDGCGLTGISMCEFPVKNMISLDCAALTNPLDLSCLEYTPNVLIGALPILSSTCDMPTAEIRFTDGDFISGNGCGSGTVIRTYTVFVDNVATTATCTQTLNINEPAIDISCPTQPAPADCDIANFPWISPVLNNGAMLCDDDVMIVARTPDVVDNSAFPSITVTRIWDITRACDSYASTCSSTVVFEDCCDAVPDQVVRIGSFSNPNQILLGANVVGGVTLTVDWSLYTFEICTVNHTESITDPIKQNLNSAPIWSVLGGSDGTVIREYFVKYWFTATGKPVDPNCPGPQVTDREATGTTSRIAGKIINEENDEVEEVMVDLQNSIEPVDMTGANGVYDFPEVLVGQNYSVVPSKDTDPLNGISTYDLVLMSQHIIGQNPLTTPYKMIAADINNDGKISTFDMVQLRQLILFAVTDFGANTSWRFIDASYVFPDPADPWSQTFPEQYNITNLNADMIVDFVAVKVGDLNCSAKPNSLISSQSRTGGEKVILSANDAQLKAGESQTLVVSLPTAEELYSCQFTLGFNEDLIEVVNIEALNENVGQEHFGTNLITEGAITFGWHNTRAISLEGQLFEVEIRANRNLFLKDVFSINSSFTEAIAYNEIGEESVVELVFNKEVQAALEFNAFKLEQNKPNPFLDETVIGFEIPSDSKVRLTVFNLDGKVLVQSENFYTAGLNQIKITKTELNSTGVLYYQLDTEFGSATRKMIVINN